MSHTCGRRSESFSPMTVKKDADFYRVDDCCSYCGSLNPETFMARLEAGDVLLGSTDKNYKVYVKSWSGSLIFRQSYRACPWRDVKPEEKCKGPDTCTHWVTRDTDSAKFYFQHLSEEQQERFIALLNEKRIKFQGNIGFYVLPFFCCTNPSTKSWPVA